MQQKIYLFLICFFYSIFSFSQIFTSVATDASVLRNLNKGQTFWAFGQNVQGNFHFSKKETAYALACYYTTGSFNNKGSALADSPFTSPQKIDYNIRSKISYHQVSLGWKHYVKGSFNEERIRSVYATAGFGLVFGRAENNFDRSIDTSIYSFSNPLPGTKAFKKLTLDLGLGVDQPIATDIYLYGELKSWLPFTETESPYLYKNKGVPFTVLLNFGVRVLFQ